TCTAFPSCMHVPFTRGVFTRGVFTRGVFTCGMFARGAFARRVDTLRGRHYGRADEWNRRCGQSGPAPGAAPARRGEPAAGVRLDRDGEPGHRVRVPVVFCRHPVHGLLAGATRAYLARRLHPAERADRTTL